MNAVMAAAYWMIGRHIVEFERSGEERAAYGTALIERLALDLKKRFGRGFSRQNLQQTRFPRHRRFARHRLANLETFPTSSLDRIGRVVTDLRRLALPARVVRLCSAALAPESTPPRARSRGAARWWVRSPARLTDRLQFYERTAVSRDKAAMLARGSQAQHEDQVLHEQAIKEPYVLEFLDLRTPRRAMKQAKLVPYWPTAPYDLIFRDVAGIFAAARQSAARSVTVVTAGYRLTGRYVGGFDQSCEDHFEYRSKFLPTLASMPRSEEPATTDRIHHASIRR